MRKKGSITRSSTVRSCPPVTCAMIWLPFSIVAPVPSAKGTMVSGSEPEAVIVLITIVSSFGLKSVMTEGATPVSPAVLMPPSSRSANTSAPSPPVRMLPLREIRTSSPAPPLSVSFSSVINVSFPSSTSVVKNVAPTPVIVSLPKLPPILSSPRPPKSVSSPARPRIRSPPPRASTKLFPSTTSNVSGSDVPMIVSSPCVGVAGGQLALVIRQDLWAARAVGLRAGAGCQARQSLIRYRNQSSWPRLLLLRQVKEVTPSCKKNLQVRN